MSDRTAPAESVLDLVGNTPMVRLRRLAPEGSAEVLAKMESWNPAGSVKDRIAVSMVEAAAAAGELRPGDTIVEPTSGNTGIGLALVAAVRGYRLIITMPDDSSRERAALLQHYGAQVVLTPARKLMQGAIDRAQAIVAENPRCFMPGQFRNLANPAAHIEHTGPEILEATGSRLDAFVAGVGTGGTVSGVGAVLKEHCPAARIVAVEPERSRALSGGPVATHAIQGIGAGFVPETLDRSVIDEVVTCSDRDAIEMARRLAREEGISSGVSGGAAVFCALRVAEELGAGKRVVTVIPDSFDRYLSEAAPGAAAGGGLDFII